jgi:hypothetical protein
VLASVLADSESGRDLQALREELARGVRDGEPWRVRDRLDPLATLDVAAWTGLLGLFSECPVVAEAIEAMVERRTGGVSATAFTFIATRQQIDLVERFLQQLPRAFGA